MTEIFRTILILSGFGLILTAILLILKPITVKKFPAKWQYIVWIIVMLSMLVPFYKFIPKQEAQKWVPIHKTDIILPEATNDRVYVTIPDGIQTAADNDAPAPMSSRHKIPLWDLAAYIWGLGVLIYIFVVGTSYAVYLVRKRKCSVKMGTIAIDSVKRELGIKRKIRLKVCKDISSPMLVGVICPTIYIPQKEFSDENLRMIFLHELMHYRRGDLFVKWLAVLVNAVHWFNPFAYLLCANVGEACEISCDMAVTKGLSAEEQKLYMNTILDLVN